ncbi:MAG TPA: peptidase S41, partial [Bacteroidales bacterium]|nr:peptidase S41 [Bacteroidales bacterium]
MNKNTRKKRIPIILLAIVLAVISTAFLINQESRDFKLGKSLDIFFSLVRELNTFYVD